MPCAASYILERHLKREEVIYPKTQTSLFRSEPVYRRSQVLVCKAPEGWRRVGREVIDGEEPRKMVKMRAMTIGRRRELEAAKELGEGEIQQGLYSEDQTELWRSPPVVDVSHGPLQLTCPLASEHLYLDLSASIGQDRQELVRQR